MQREPVRKLWSTLARRGHGGLVGPELEPCQACHCHLIPSMWEAHFGEGLLHEVYGKSARGVSWMYGAWDSNQIQPSLLFAKSMDLMLLLTR